MRKYEQQLWDAMHGHAPFNAWLQRVENICLDGMPDVYVGFSGVWVELKAPRPRLREATPVLGESEGLRISQKNWHLKNASYANAPRSYILIRVCDTRELFLMPGRIAPVINAMSRAFLRQSSLASTWDQVFEVVMNG